MSGNKTDNGVLEIGTDEIRLSYQEDTPGQSVDEYIKEKEKSFHEQKDKVKKSFKQVVNIKPKVALNHPNWKMGKKISIDS